MKNYVLDASAAVRYLTNGIGEEKVDALIHRSQKHEVHLLICVVNWGEALYVLAGMAGLGKATADLKTMSAFVELVAVDEALAESAACLLYTSINKSLVANGATLVTEAAWNAELSLIHISCSMAVPESVVESEGFRGQPRTEDSLAVAFRHAAGDLMVRVWEQECRQEQ